MSWSYSGDPSSSELDMYRFQIGDTIETEPIMQNEEIQYILSTYSENNVRLYHLFSRAAMLFARDIKKSLGPQSEDPTTRTRFFQDKAEEYGKALRKSGISIPTYAYPKAFRKGMQNNPPYPRRGGGYIV